MGVSSIDFSPCQRGALEKLTGGRENLFVTGSAGSGKSFLIRHYLRSKERKTFPVVASTGAAAVLVGGRTFHSFFGLGILEGGVESSVARALQSKRVVKRLRAIEGFVLDEVSMISGPTLAAAERVCRLARKIHAPWGGARVIAVGDFAQLPPVRAGGGEKEWAFLDESWDRSGFSPVVLKTVLRCRDADYCRVLNEVRDGRVGTDVRDFLDSKVDTDYEGTSTRSTHLFPRRDMAERFNRERLGEVESPLREFPTAYAGDPRGIETLKKQAPVAETLQIKKSALVMIRVNDPAFRYVNGSVGTVAAIDEEGVVVRLQNGREEEICKNSFSLLDGDGREIAVARNFPLALAYGTTIHKAQGATLDRLVCDLRRLWEPGQAYVALSRLRSGEGLTLTGWDEDSIRVDPRVVEFHRSLENG
jgi:ATP-dependent exoDNAse (exonuclease V) alpha subunit